MQGPSWREVSEIVERMAARQRAALINALSAFNAAGGEPSMPTSGADAYPLGWEDTALPHGG
ncbi:hypothetical protein ACFU5O_11835 [Streptomyces sp. NPDC057445]|uniref:hypothetical protein n=1 Tax=Streptomyces sp. NPDC057445 TaxID=3346136 RepID=UPI003685B700